MENRSDFQTGDVVQLISGGPEMTVEKVSEYSGSISVHCYWFAGSKKQESSFKAGTLKKIDEGKEEK